MSESNTSPLEQSFLVFEEGCHSAVITFSKIPTRDGWEFKHCSVEWLKRNWTLNNWRSLVIIGKEIDRLLNELNDGIDMRCAMTGDVSGEVERG